MHEPHLKAMAALLRRCQPRHDLYTVFGDCMEAMAISIANSVDHEQREAREARYLAIVAQYDRNIVETFPQILAELVSALEAGTGDVLGPLFHDLELHNKERRQYFTPYAISRCMAEIAVSDVASARAIIDEHGFMTAMEPACGAGSMIVALADVLRGLRINYQRHLHVTAIDIDPRAVHMAYTQLSLLHIPAHLIVGNSLSGEHREHWYTPAHILGGWNGRLADRMRRLPVQALSPSPITVPALSASDRQGGAAAAHPNVEPRQLRLF